jgi:hypothetical protein
MTPALQVWRVRCRNGGSQESEFAVIAGSVILIIVIIFAAYVLDAPGECLRYNIASLLGDPFLDTNPRSYRVIVGLIAALVLYGGPWLLNRFFHLFGKPWLEILVIVIGVVLAGLIPPSFFGNLCHEP